MSKLIAVFLFLSLALASNADSSQQRVDIRARRFEYIPNEITIKKGVPVTLVVHSEDVTHGLLIKQLGVNKELRKGRSEEVTFVPQQAGTIEAQCNHFCGVGHGRMRLVIHVTE